MAKNNAQAREQIISKIASKMKIEESVVKEVINHQFKGVVRALSEHTSVEISGFGNFYFLPNRAEVLIKKMEENLEKILKGEPTKIVDTPENIKKDIAVLNQKIRDARKG